MRVPTGRGSVPRPGVARRPSVLPAASPRVVRAAGIDMQLAAACKPRDCGENNTVLLYDAARPAVYGKVYQAGRTTLIGNPPPPLSAELDRLWQQEWRGAK